MNKFGAWLWERAEARLGPNLRRQDVADYIGVRSDNTIGNWLKDHTPSITLENIYLIAAAFDMDPADVVRVHEESLAAELPKGRTVTTTQATRRRKTKLSELPIRRDITGI